MGPGLLERLTEEHLFQKARPQRKSAHTVRSESHNKPFMCIVH